MPFDSPDLLRQAGYEAGDIPSVTRFGPVASRDSSVSSPSYVAELGFWSGLLQPDQLSEDGTLRVNLQLNFVPGTGEEVFAKLVNRSDAEDVAGTEIASTANAFQQSGFVEYTPPTTDDLLLWQIEVKTEPGDNDSNVFDPSVYIGDQL
jgi:hypothetical protein